MCDVPYPDHDDDCILNCPVPAGEKCRIGHCCDTCTPTRTNP